MVELTQVEYDALEAFNRAFAPIREAVEHVHEWAMEYRSVKGIEFPQGVQCQVRGCSDWIGVNMIARALNEFEQDKARGKGPF